MDIIFMRHVLVHTINYNWFSINFLPTKYLYIYIRDVLAVMNTVQKDSNYQQNSLATLIPLTLLTWPSCLGLKLKHMAHTNSFSFYSFCSFLYSFLNWRVPLHGVKWPHPTKTSYDRTQSMLKYRMLKQRLCITWDEF